MVRDAAARRTRVRRRGTCTAGCPRGRLDQRRLATGALTPSPRARGGAAAARGRSIAMCRQTRPNFSHRSSGSVRARSGLTRPGRLSTRPSPVPVSRSPRGRAWRERRRRAPRLRHASSSTIASHRPPRTPDGEMAGARRAGAAAAAPRTAYCKRATHLSRKPLPLYAWLPPPAVCLSHELSHPPSDQCGALSRRARARTSHSTC